MNLIPTFKAWEITSGFLLSSEIGTFFFVIYLMTGITLLISSLIEIFFAPGRVD